MSEYKRPQTLDEFNKNFAPKKPLMNETEAFYESSRCLFCYDAPCITACPTGIDIPLFIKQIQTGNVTGSAKTIFDANWLGNACGKVCPTGVLCEGACVYIHQGIKPIDIGRLQNYATQKAIEEKKPIFTQGTDNGKKIAVIGSGPAGIACACELRTLGYQVDIFEAKAIPSGLHVHGVAPYKITNQEVLDEVNYLQEQLGFSIHLNQAVTSKEQFQKLEQEYDALFLGVGLGKTANRGLKGQDLSGVIGAVEFIEQLKLDPTGVQIPSQVVVIGGGNTAMDAASECARLGADMVTLAYRKSKEEMGAYDFEYELAVKSGVRGLFHANPKAIHGNGQVSEVEFTQVSEELGNNAEIAGSEFSVPANLVILATGQEKQTGLYDLIGQITFDTSGRIEVTSSYQTSNPIYFAGGDAVNGGAEVVNAAYEGKQAAVGIDNYLNNK